MSSRITPDATKSSVFVRNTSPGYVLCSAGPTQLSAHSSVLFLFDMCLIEPLRWSVACNRRVAEFPRSELRLSSLPVSRRLLGDNFLSSGLPARNHKPNYVPYIRV